MQQQNLINYYHQVWQNLNLHWKENKSFGPMVIALMQNRVPPLSAAFGTRFFILHDLLVCLGLRRLARGKRSVLRRRHSQYGGLLHVA